MSKQQEQQQQPPPPEQAREIIKIEDLTPDDDRLRGPFRVGEGIPGITPLVQTTTEEVA